jgi:predicted regulator of Ras-like GTPase activity (Roadblock/LC7/MglB family)
MAQDLDAILQTMSGDVNGYVASVIAGMDGLSIAQHASKKLSTDAISAQLTLLLKLVETSTLKLNAGQLEDELLTTQDVFILMRFLPGKEFFLGVVADRRTGNLGNLRLITRMYTERLAKAMPK